MATSVPDIEFTQTGIVVPEESVVLDGVLADINDAFGGNLNIDNLETPQGQLASSTAAIIGKKNDELAYYVNAIDPDYADGRMQDAIARIYYLTRRPAVATQVQVECIGVEGTVIPIGATVKDSSGNTYVCMEAGTIPGTGTVTLSFENTVTGPVPAPAGTVSRIYRAIPGLDTVNNVSDGVLGVDVESRADFEHRRRNSVAINSAGSLAAIYGAVFAVDGVTDVYCFENATGETVTVGATDYELEPHSLYVAVAGGSSNDIAEAIWTKKAAGCSYNGNTTVTIHDEIGYSYPYPSYEVKYQIPAAMPIQFAVQLVNKPQLPSDIIDQVKAAIVSAFRGEDNGPRARIGSDIIAGRFYAGVYAISPYVSILSILLGADTPTLTSYTVGIDYYPTIDEDDITVALV